MSTTNDADYVGTVLRSSLAERYYRLSSNSLERIALPHASDNSTHFFGNTSVPSDVAKYSTGDVPGKGEKSQVLYGFFRLTLTATLSPDSSVKGMPAIKSHPR